MTARGKDAAPGLTVERLEAVLREDSPWDWKLLVAVIESRLAADKALEEIEGQANALAGVQGGCVFADLRELARAARLRKGGSND